MSQREIKETCSATIIEILGGLFIFSVMSIIICFFFVGGRSNYRRLIWKCCPPEQTKRPTAHGTMVLMPDSL
jgi:hypothetical protein